MKWVRRGPTAVKKMYELWEVDHLRQLFKHYDVDCVFDVGANVGQYATMLREKVGYRRLVVSFEPDPSVASKLAKKAEGQPLWVVEDLAISAEDGTAQFNVMKHNQFSSLCAPRHDHVDLFTRMNKVSKTVTVRTENLATTVGRLRKQFGFSRPFLKLDTQGFDTQIVSAAPKAVSTFVGLQSELAIKKLYADSVDFRQAITVYENCGFELSAIVPNNAGHFPRLIEADCIMVRADLL